MILFRKISFYLALIGLTATIVLVRKLSAVLPTPVPLAEPSRSPFQKTVAATGIIEARRENVKIGATKSGLIARVMVEVGDRVKEGDALLQLDDREARARLAAVQAQLSALQSAVAIEENQLADSTDQFNRVTRLEKDKVVSEDERIRKQFSLQAATARLEKTKADALVAKRQVEEAEVALAVLTIRAPRIGSILQLNVRSGEYANVIASEPLMILGDITTLQIRADVDEQNAPLIGKNPSGQASLKGNPELKFPLKFVRIEPFVIPKKSLTGDSTERVDTRVLQIIFEFARPNTPVYVGQQMDVFIQRPGTAALAAKSN